jgi:hypothetical protein
VSVRYGKDWHEARQIPAAGDTIFAVKAASCQKSTSSAAALDEESWFDPRRGNKRPTIT